MSYASLMVHVDLETDLGGRVSVAAELANLFNAHVIGVAGWAPMSLFLAADGPVDPEPTEFHLQDMKTLLDQKGKEFCAAIAERGRRAEWRSALDLPTEVVAREARAADLLIVGNERETKDPFRALDPGSLLLKAGRPVLVVPKGVTSLPLKRVAIAWKDAREARRAVLDALPFLQKADSVVIVEISEDGDASRSRHRVADVAHYLARHRIEIVTEQVRPAEASARGGIASPDPRPGDRLDCRGCLRPLATGRMGVRRGHARIAGGEPDLLPVLPLNAGEEDLDRPRTRKP